MNPNKRSLSVTILGCVYIGVGSVGFVYHQREILARHAFHYDDLLVVGVPQDPIQLNAFPLVFGGRSVYGSLTGTPIDSEDALAFSVLENIRPMIETVSLEQAANAYARMMEGKARFRMVLVTKDGAA